MNYHLPQGEIDINTIVFDLNGTLSEYGAINSETKQWIKQLKKLGFKLIMLTSDQRGNAYEIANSLQIDYHVAKTSMDKQKFVEQLQEPFFAIGNARNDIPMFRKAAISFATLQSEGIHPEIINSVDVVVPSIANAFHLIADENGLISTMKI